MTAHAWHASDEMLRRYAEGAGGVAATASVEAHLLGCADCRGRIAHTVALQVEPAWERVAERLHQPQPPPVVRLLQRLGLAEGEALLLCASRSLNGAWTVATIAVVAFAALAAIPGVAQGRALYLLVAPLVPVAGVVAAFRSTDPLAEMTTVTPYSPARLALLRTLAVLITGVPLSVLVGAAVPGIAWLAFAWLLPALALTLLTLLMMTWSSPEPAGVAVAGAWAAAIAGSYVGHNVPAVVGAGVQPIYLVLVVLAGVSLVLRFRVVRPPGGFT